MHGLSDGFEKAYHVLTDIKQCFAKIQNLQEALSVGITEAKHCPPQKQIKARHCCISNVWKLHEQQVCSFNMPSEISTK